MTRRARVWAWAAGALGLLVLAIAAGEVAGWPFLRGPLQKAMANALAVPVRLDGGFSVRFIVRPHLAAGHLQIGAAQQVNVPHLVDARDVDVTWRWRDVWRWREGGLLRVQSLAAGALDANLVRGEDGRASWQVGPPPDARRRPDGEAESPLGGVPRFGTLRVTQGHIVVDDKPLQTQLVVDLRGGEGDDVAAGAKTGYRARVNGRWRALPLALSVRTGAALPLLQDADSDDKDQTPSIPVRVEGEAGAAHLLFDGTAAALMGERRLQGAIRFRGPSLAKVGEPLGLTLPQTPPFELTGELGHAGGIWHLRADRAAIGRSLLNGDFRFDTNPHPPRLSGRLSGPRLVLSDLAPAVGAPPTSTTAAATPARVLPQRRFDLPSLRAMDADVQVAIDELDFGSDAMSALRGLATQVLLKGGVLTLRDLKATVAGGQFTGTTSLDANADPAKWAADLHFAAIDVAGWLRGLRSAEGQATAPANTNAKALKAQRDAARKGGEQPVRAYLTGTLSGSVQATGRGRSTAEILSSLDGHAQATLRDGTVSHLVTEAVGLDVAQALGVLVTSDRPLPLRCARVDLALDHGVVKPQVAVIDNADSTVNIQGQVDLRDESLALRAVARPKDFSPLALRAPITLGGTMAAPKIGVEGGKLAGKVLGALALGAVVAPVAALLPLMDRGTAPDHDPCAGAPVQPIPPKGAAASGAAK